MTLKSKIEQFRAEKEAEREAKKEAFKRELSKQILKQQEKAKARGREKARIKAIPIRTKVRTGAKFARAGLKDVGGGLLKASKQLEKGSRPHRRAVARRSVVGLDGFLDAPRPKSRKRRKRRPRPKPRKRRKRRPRPVSSGFDFGF